MERRRFEAVWQCIKTWDVHVPDAYTGYMGATGNHVRAILDALAPYLVSVQQCTLRPDPSSVVVVSLPPEMLADDVYDAIVTAIQSAYDHLEEWERMRLPIVFLEDGMSLEQMDEEAMRRAGWVRLPEPTQEDPPA